ncbi:DUF2339 domain-containing protein [Phreatobacter aquaticus]|uniref:DUF2339 domain-containing protein n=1 Tax=Phreatobacter aquaticus TaxID=2570229 RepID=A0A4D7QM56_9HYPH|nr:DUF2339 domain-containing protein [Phreatobacter aquaticus]QCK86506.1 DUF2339 domain-containing protein [Phreatobacter aquaticus]
MEIVLGVLLVAGLILVVPVLAIIAFIRTSDLTRQIGAVGIRLVQAEGEVLALRRALALGQPVAMPPEAPVSPDMPLSPVTDAPVASHVAPEPPQIVTEAPPVAEPQPVDPGLRPSRGGIPAISTSAPLEAIDPIVSEPAPAPANLIPQPARTQSLEEMIGSKWSVWVGALALGLGGIFLVRYSIEQGLVGPGVRLMLGAIFSMALLAGGEWLRTADKGLPTLPAADIPSAITGAGVVTAFGTIWAAHALYGFIGPAFAFFALGAVGIGALVLAGLHGPLLGGIGLVAAFGAPFLVSTDQPSPYAFPIYASVITAACYTLAWIRGWRWLTVAATIAATVLGTVAMIGTRGSALPTLIQAVLGIATAAIFLVPGIRFTPDHPRGIAKIATGALVAFAGLAMLAVLDSRHEAFPLVLFGAIALTMIGLTWRTPSVVFSVPATGLFATLIVLAMAAGVRRPLAITDPLAIPDAFPDSLARIVWAGLAFALVYGIGAAAAAIYRRQVQARTVLVLVTTSVLVPLAMLAIVYGKVEGFIISPRFAALAMVLAATFGAATEATHRLRSGARPGLASASAIYAIGALAAVAFALTLLLERAWLTLALSAMIAGIAWVYTLRPLPHLRWVAAITGLAVLGRLFWDPAINGAGVGEMVILNWLLPGYGVPAASAAFAALLLRRRRGEDTPVQVLEGLAMVFAALLVIVETRHAFGAHGHRLFYAPMRFGEAATHTVTILAFGLGLSRIASIRPGALWQNVTLLARYASWAWIVAVMGFAMNPWLSGYSIGPHPIFNWALLGYGFAGVLALGSALLERRAGRDAEAKIMAVLGLGLVFFWLNTVIGALFRGPVLSRGSISDGELYAYSAAWLVLGLILLGLGAAFASKVLRLASAALVGLTVLKVFLVDMSDLTGLWRALSFIGLGLVLLLVGRIYQRVLGIAQKPADGHGQ